MTQGGPARCAGCAGCGSATSAGVKPSPALARYLTVLATLLFAGPLTTLLLLATLLETADPGAAAAALGFVACTWVLLLRRLRPWIDRRLVKFGSELPQSLLVIEETGAGAASLIQSTRSQS